MSHILILNVWENSVGLYHAANMGLLRTVMDVHSQIIDHSEKNKVVLLFVIRDYACITPRDNLIDVLTSDLQHIWDSLRNSSEYCFSDFFELRFAFLPHKFLQLNDFELSLNELRESFENLESTFIALRPMAHEIIAPCDFSMFAENIWSRVQSNRDLDMPTERELLAQYRCDEIATVL